MEGRKTIEVVAGDTIQIGFTTPWPLSGYTVTSTIKDNYGDGATIASFTVSTSGTTGNLSLSAAASAALLPYVGQPDLCFDLKFDASGTITHSEKAFLAVRGAVT